MWILWLSIVSGLGYDPSTAIGGLFEKEFSRFSLESQIALGSKIDGGSTLVATQSGSLILGRSRAFRVGLEAHIQQSERYGEVWAANLRLGYANGPFVFWVRLPDTSEHRASGIRIDLRASNRVWFSSEVTFFDNNRRGASVKIGLVW